MKRLVLLLFISQLFVNTGFAQNTADEPDWGDYISKDLDTVYTEFINSGASIRLPLHFEPFTQGQYEGFIHKGTASTMIAQFIDSASFISVTTNMNEETFLKQGAELISEIDLKTNEGRQAKAYIIRFTVKETPINRIMFFTGDHQSTLLLTANYPELFAGILKNVFIASFLTVKFK
ncbi:MAG: hypothetical protein C0592_06775 [Marinilabiliales bacterium]|nr:MAG: hypothetical protein C0592_06775 [Marinilabiliales bacterium]